MPSSTPYFYIQFLMKKESDQHNEYLSKAIVLAENNVVKGGGPFGAVIVKDGKIVSSGVNRVTQKHDPTAHAEIEAIRQATELLGDYELKGCTLYSSCEPCPMCLGAIYWARLDKLYFASTREDAQEAGFSDADIYEELERKPDERLLPTFHIKPLITGEEFKAWDNYSDKITY